MPPLLKLVIARNRESHGETVNEDNLVLPAHKIYEGEHRLEDRIEPTHSELLDEDAIEQECQEEKNTLFQFGNEFCIKM